MRYADAPARREELLRRLGAEGYVSSSAVADEFGVSEMTIRRDLRQLAAEGLARRVIGGASLPDLGHARPFDERAGTGGGEKRAIAAACLSLLEGATTIALDAGTTVAPLTDLVPAGTTVVSHSAPVVQAAIERGDLDVVAIGGTYQRETRSFAGPAARRSIADHSFDVAVLSATAVDRTGLLCANALDAELKQELSRSARTTVLLVDHSKLGARAPIRVGGFDLVDAIVTDDGADADDLAVLRASGVRVLVAATAGMSLNSGSGEDVLGAVDRKDEEESVTGGDADDEDAGSGRTERTAAQPELRDIPEEVDVS